MLIFLEPSYVKLLHTELNAAFAIALLLLKPYWCILLAGLVHMLLVLA